MKRNWIYFVLIICILTSCQNISENDEITINLKFKSQLVVIPVGQQFAHYNDFDPSIENIKEYFQTLSDSIVFEKFLPDCAPEDTVWINVDGKIKILNDWSQVFVVRIYYSSELQAEILTKLNAFDEIEWAESLPKINPNDE